MIDLKEELREDMLREAKQEEQHEVMMYKDEEYAIEYFEDQILEAQEILTNVSNHLWNYGHQLTPKEILDAI